MVEFGKLHSDGSYEHTRSIPQSAMQKCPHFILVPEHYREDNTCRCNDPEHTEMFDWGYIWKNGKWITPRDDAVNTDDWRTVDEIDSEKSVFDMTREERKQLAAACGQCGGWTNFGGMSQHYDGPDGCTCNNPNNRTAARFK